MNTPFALLVLLAGVQAGSGLQPPPPVEFNALIALSTVRLSGPCAKDAKLICFGTGFFVGRPDPGGNPNEGAQVLVSAAHVLDDIGGEVLSVLTRVRDERGRYSRKPVHLRVRAAGRNLYSRHPTADVVAMYTRIVEVTNVASMELFARDELLRKFEVSLGDEVMAAGYPHFAEAPGGFPILRSGRISSYPLTPASTVDQILIDYNVHPGNSGGPVYLSQRSRFLMASRRMFSAQILLGLVSQQMFAPNGTRLEVAAVVPAKFIYETITKMPPPVY